MVEWVLYDFVVLCGIDVVCWVDCGEFWLEF